MFRKSVIHKVFGTLLTLEENFRKEKGKTPEYQIDILKKMRSLAHKIQLENAASDRAQCVRSIQMFYSLSSLIKKEVTGKKEESISGYKRELPVENYSFKSELLH